MFFTKFLELYRVHGEVYVVGIILLVFFFLFEIRKWEHVSSGFVWSTWEVWMGFPIYFRGFRFHSPHFASWRNADHNLPNLFRNVWAIDPVLLRREDPRGRVGTSVWKDPLQAGAASPPLRVSTLTSR